MPLPTILAQLEALAPLLRAAGREALLQVGAATITHGGLSTEETEAAHRRLAELADTIPVILVTAADRDKATRLCQTTAQRLTHRPVVWRGHRDLARPDRA